MITDRNYHMLIAGTSGCGKSTLIRNMIETLKKETDVQFVLIDPKIVELKEYRHLPKTLMYARDEDDIYETLEDCYTLMMDRFNRMDDKDLKTSDEPHVFIFIDEMADLLASDYSKQILKILTRIVLKGRAARIHLVLCTQQSTRDVIPGSIRNNLDNVVCMRQVDPYLYSYLLHKKMPDLPTFGYAYVRTPRLQRVEKVEIANVWNRISA